MHINSELIRFEITIDEHGVWRAELMAHSRLHLLALAETLVEVLEADPPKGKLGPDVEISKPVP